MGKQRNVKKREKWGKMDLSICIFVAFSICFFFAFVLLLFCFLPRKKQNKSKKTNKKQIEKAKKNANVFFPIFFSFCLSFFSLLFCFCVFWILLIWFLFFPFLFLHLSWVFSSLLILRISYGLVNIRLAISVQLLVLGMIKALTSTDATEERKRERGSGYAQRERERWNDIDICPT